MDIVAAHAAKHPDKPALVLGERTLSWREYLHVRNRLAHSLARLGLGAGEHVVVYAHNSLEYLIAGAAVRAIGGIPVPMNHRLTADEVVHILDNADAAAVFLSEEFLPMADRVRARVPQVRHWIAIGGERREWAVPFDELVAAGDPAITAAEGLGGSMIYTAGTTGKPKGALRRASDPASVVPRLQELDALDPDHVHLVAGPLYHSAPGGFALYAHMVGNTVVVMERFDPQEALRLIELHRCTSTFMAPTLLKRIVDLPAAVRARYDVSSMRSLVMAAAPCPMRVKEDVLAYFGPVLYEFYGSTELGVNTVLRPEDMLRKPGSCGRAASGLELAILDDAGQPCPVGTPGELVVRRYGGVFDGYYKNDAATKETQHGDWLSVGDVAWMDTEGFVYICDRKRDMIISGGVNIYPAEIEDALHRHPGIQDAAVFGVPDSEWGERVHAAVQCRPGTTLTPAEVIEFCRARLAGYKVPREVSFHADFPRDSAGKLVKRTLREPYWAGRAVRV
ncbi:MAG TPA: AMP-binding protein [Methylomirabilota bacterium]|jgi:acyl-CoA synthetase (AMP-forming)/AMP-acid ligase II|nr:AMP-binding protein [Methylomirabilota bacterium]